MLPDMGAENTLTGTIAEARRQVEICNACRYCEGYCAVFPAINRERVFADGDIFATTAAVATIPASTSPRTSSR